ncbi:MAG TPA: hypothetical protein VIY29_05625 [Ktedonobacteraceae bacterium]
MALARLVASHNHHRSTFELLLTDVEMQPFLPDLTFLVSGRKP